MPSFILFSLDKSIYRFIPSGHFWDLVRHEEVSGHISVTILAFGHGARRSGKILPDSRETWLCRWAGGGSRRVTGPSIRPDRNCISRAPCHAGSRPITELGMTYESGHDVRQWA